MRYTLKTLLYWYWMESSESANGIPANTWGAMIRFMVSKGYTDTSDPDDVISGLKTSRLPHGKVGAALEDLILYWELTEDKTLLGTPLGGYPETIVNPAMTSWKKWSNLKTLRILKLKRLQDSQVTYIHEVTIK